MRAPQPEPPIPGSFATPSLLAWIVNGKYVMSLPLYRIETDLKACGATISRQDMANWMMNVHARWLAKVHERMKVELLSHVRIHADETTVQVLKEPNREAKCLCSISCCGFSHDDFSGLGRACRPRNGLNWMVLVSPPERTGKDYDQHAPSTVYPSFAAERGIRRVDRAENTCRRSRRCVSTSRRRICRPCRR